MDKNNPPTTLGVLKPVGHTVIAFADKAQSDEAHTVFANNGFAASSMVHYSPHEMLAQVDAQLLQASPFASLGYEFDLIKAHKVLALGGSHCLVVEAATDVLAEQVAGLVKTLKPQTAQHYGTFMIQELTEKLPGRMGEQGR